MVLCSSEHILMGAAGHLLNESLLRDFVFWVFGMMQVCPNLLQSSHSLYFISIAKALQVLGYTLEVKGLFPLGVQFSFLAGFMQSFNLQHFSVLWWMWLAVDKTCCCQIQNPVEFIIIWDVVCIAILSPLLLQHVFYFSAGTKESDSQRCPRMLSTMLAYFCLQLFTMEDGDMRSIWEALGVPVTELQVDQQYSAIVDWLK